MALITISQQQAIKPISPNWAAAAKVAGGVSNFDNLAAEVEDTELARMLGIELLYNIQTAPTAPANVDLLNGKQFTTTNGNVLKFKGIRYQLAYLIFGKMINVSHVADTFTGFVQKQRTEAEPITAGDRKRVQQDAENIAMQDFEIMKIFLNQNKSTYTLWKCTDTKKPVTPIFTGIKKTIL